MLFCSCFAPRNTDDADNDANDVFTHDGITYTILTDKKITWYEAYRRCTQHTGIRVSLE